MATNQDTQTQTTPALPMDLYKLELQWDQDNLNRSLELVYEYTVTKVNDYNIAWYTNNARKNKRWARLLRLIAIVMTGVGGIFPVLSGLIVVNGQTVFDPAWATVIIGAGAGALALDRFFGYSTSWMRSITTELNLKARLETFQFEWETERITWQASTPKIEEARALVVKCDKFLMEVSSIVQEETQMWLQEFQSTLRSLDETLKLQSERSRPGSLSVRVENGEQYAYWELLVDDRSQNQDGYTGSSAAVKAIFPGNYKIQVVGRDSRGQRRAFAETIVKIQPDQISEINLALPAMDEA